jgi:hypothetical protein
MNVKYVVAADFETSGFYHQKDHFNSNITKSFEWRIEQLNRRATAPERRAWWLERQHYAQSLRTRPGLSLGGPH